MAKRPEDEIPKIPAPPFPGEGFAFPDGAVDPEREPELPEFKAPPLIEKGEEVTLYERVPATRSNNRRYLKAMAKAVLRQFGMKGVKAWRQKWRDLRRSGETKRSRLGATLVWRGRSKPSRPDEARQLVSPVSSDQKPERPTITGQPNLNAVVELFNYIVERLDQIDAKLDQKGGRLG